MPNARKTDPHTSHDAARSVDHITDTQLYILQALSRPRTDIQLVEAYSKLVKAPNASESGIRSRRAELVRKGKVVDSGIRQVLPSGRMAIVWARRA
jgi:hypothetical protein